MSDSTKILKNAGFVGPHSIGNAHDIKKSLIEQGHGAHAVFLGTALLESRIYPDTPVSVTVLTWDDRKAGNKRHPETAVLLFSIGSDEVAIHRANAMRTSRTSPAPLYGRISQMLNGLVGGTSPQTIVCKDNKGLREVCVFNKEGDVWSDANEAELQTVLKALQAAGRAA